MSGKLGLVEFKPWLTLIVKPLSIAQLFQQANRILVNRKSSNIHYSTQSRICLDVLRIEISFSPIRMASALAAIFFWHT